MKDLPVRTLIAVLLIGLLCLVAKDSGYEKNRLPNIIIKKREPPCFRKFCSAAQCSP